MTSKTTQNINSPSIFISHNSEDAELAEAFSRLLKSVSLGFLESFRSSDNKGTDGIDAGGEWFPTIMKKLDTATDVICLFTPSCINNIWMLYEAGVAHGKLNIPVIAIAIGMSKNSIAHGPFAQFQNSADDDGSITKVIMQLLRRMPGAKPDQVAIEEQVRKFNKEKEKILAKKKAITEVPGFSVEGEWEYKCLLASPDYFEDGGNSHGGKCKITVSKSTYTTKLIVRGQRTWWGIHNQKGTIGKKTSIKPARRWNSDEAAYISDTKFMYMYRIEDGRIEGITIIDITDRVNDNQLEGNFFYLPIHNGPESQELYLRLLETKPETKGMIFRERGSLYLTRIISKKPTSKKTAKRTLRKSAVKKKLNKRALKK